MKKEPTVIWIFPIITFVLFFTILFTAKYSRPITGFAIGLIFGFILGLLTKLIYDECYKLDKIKDFRRFDNSYIESLDEILKVPYYFLYIWITPLVMYFARYFKYFVIFWGIIIIFYLIVRSIIKGF